MFSPRSVKCVWRLRNTCYLKHAINSNLDCGSCHKNNNNNSHRRYLSRLQISDSTTNLVMFKQCNVPFQNLFTTISTLPQRGLVTNSGEDAKAKPSKTEAAGKGTDNTEILLEDDEKKLSLFQRYKKMAKEYWYVLIPVHLATSTVWFGAFFYASKCGFDIVPYLEYFGASDTVIRPFKNSSLGHVAVAWALYKVATPARYTVTLAGTTMSIRFLTSRGLIKPMPSKENIKAIYQQKKDEYIQRKSKTD